MKNENEYENKIKLSLYVNYVTADPSAAHFVINKQFRHLK